MSDTDLRWVEVRQGTMRPVEGRLVGHALKFNRLSEVMAEDGVAFREIIRPGALDSVLSDDCRCLIDHESARLLGRTMAGTLKIRDDGIGLAYECQLPDTSYARDLAVSMDRGDITQCSFQFDVAKDRWSMQGATLLREILTLARLYDVSPVVFAAYPDTDVTLRSPAGAPGGKAAYYRRKLELLLAT